MTEELGKSGWLARLRDGLSRTSSRMSDGIGGIFSDRKLDEVALEELEDLLITSDLGVETSAKLCAALSSTRFNKEVSADEIRAALAQEVTKILAPVAKPLETNIDCRPHVILVTGVNGSGKTTTIGKLAKRLKEDGKTVMLAAGDTFRAAAIEQLKIWGERTGCDVVSSEQGADAASLAFEAIEHARAANSDILLIDTAGRLQNRDDLMQQLQKVVRVISKQNANAPHDTLLILDATTGQNAHSQVETFQSLCNVTGLVVTKLDGSARGGVLVALAEKFGLPIYAIGVGEGEDDLRPFDAEAFARSLVGLGA
ncbi:MAG: Signal recognition particle receptor FtsY [Alphaproteobacteria bacterium MarineAlpha11_Bin1]|nr:MAG: Signal recognition particle receptor FtsY [Alphaproteobacteria bacterium MarineAlpha11_Bin1]|tara:strand:+ start:2935 stop:3873 length:939 start_codon:yes stop_codon:yes gene_type:complete